MVPKSFYQYFQIVGGFAGLVALLWNLRWMLAFQRRRKREASMEIESIEQQLRAEELRLQEALDEIGDELVVCETEINAAFENEASRQRAIDAAKRQASRRSNSARRSYDARERELRMKKRNIMTN